MAYRFELVSRDGEILGSFTTSEQRWQAGDEVIAHGNERFRVVSVIPVERMPEFVDDPKAASSRLSRCIRSLARPRRVSPRR